MPSTWARSQARSAAGARPGRPQPLAGTARRGRRTRPPRSTRTALPSG
ncbi:MAG: hypothetical protein EVA89_36775 [Sandaracinaceae bacterium]|nr:MAG: hypothetical protein EVA89_36775 [Sandaracinaceae bacterium]